MSKTNKEGSIATPILTGLQNFGYKILFLLGFILLLLLPVLLITIIIMNMFVNYETEPVKHPYIYYGTPSPYHIYIYPNVCDTKCKQKFYIKGQEYPMSEPQDYFNDTKEYSSFYGEELVVTSNEIVIAVDGLWYWNFDVDNNKVCNFLDPNMDSRIGTNYFHLGDAPPEHKAQDKFLNEIYKRDQGCSMQYGQGLYIGFVSPDDYFTKGIRDMVAYQTKVTDRFLKEKGIELYHVPKLQHAKFKASYQYEDPKGEVTLRDFEGYMRNMFHIKPSDTLTNELIVFNNDTNLYDHEGTGQTKSIAFNKGDIMLVYLRDHFYSSNQGQYKVSFLQGIENQGPPDTNNRAVSSSSSSNNNSGNRSFSDYFDLSLIKIDVDEIMDAHPLNSIAYSIHQQIYSGIYKDNSWLDIIYILIILGILVYGISLLLGVIHVNMQSAIEVLIKILLVMFLLSSNGWDFITHYIFYPFFYVRDLLLFETLTYITDLGFEVNLNDILSNVLAVIYEGISNEVKMLMSMIFDTLSPSTMIREIGIFILRIAIFYLIASLGFVTLVVFIITTVAITLMISMIPIFLPLILFKFMKFSFADFMKNLADYSFQPVFMMIITVSTLSYVMQLLLGLNGHALQVVQYGDSNNGYEFSTPPKDTASVYHNSIKLWLNDPERYTDKVNNLHTNNKNDINLLDTVLYKGLYKSNSEELFIDANLRQGLYTQIPIPFDNIEKYDDGQYKIDLSTNNNPGFGLIEDIFIFSYGSQGKFFALDAFERRLNGENQLGNNSMERFIILFGLFMILYAAYIAVQNLPKIIDNVLGGKSFGMRSMSDGITSTTLGSMIDSSHQYSKKGIKSGVNNVSNFYKGLKSAAAIGNALQYAGNMQHIPAAVRNNNMLSSVRKRFMDKATQNIGHLYDIAEALNAKYKKDYKYQGKNHELKKKRIQKFRDGLYTIHDTIDVDNQEEREAAIKQLIAQDPSLLEDNELTLFMINQENDLMKATMSEMASEDKKCFKELEENYSAYKESNTLENEKKLQESMDQYLSNKPKLKQKVKGKSFGNAFETIENSKKNKHHETLLGQIDDTNEITPQKMKDIIRASLDDTSRDIMSKTVMYKDSNNKPAFNDPFLEDDLSELAYTSNYFDPRDEFTNRYAEYTGHNFVRGLKAIRYSIDNFHTNYPIGQDLYETYQAYINDKGTICKESDTEKALSEIKSSTNKMETILKQLSNSHVVKKATKLYYTHQYSTRGNQFKHVLGNNFRMELANDHDELFAGSDISDVACFLDTIEEKHNFDWDNWDDYVDQHIDKYSAENEKDMSALKKSLKDNKNKAKIKNKYEKWSATLFSKR